MSEEWPVQNPGRGLGTEDRGEGDLFFSVRPFVSFECCTKFVYNYSSNSVFKRNREKGRLPTEGAYNQTGEIRFSLQGKI